MQAPEIRISIASQRLDLIQDGGVVWSRPVSTSSRGTGTGRGTFRTPTGRFLVAEKHGAGAPPWMQFRSRIATGRPGSPDAGDDQVLTRILWLAGLDRENANTFSRYVYIHGTNQESLLGSPASHGCVRMANADIADLFDRVPLGTRVVIMNDDTSAP